MTFLTGWCLPAATARRTNHVRLLDAYIVHVLAGVSGFLLFITFVAIAEAPQVLGVQGVLMELCDVVALLVNEFKRDPWDMGLITAAFVGFIELAFLLVALIVTPWGARDERMRSSFAHALRRTWLHTPHMLMAVFFVGMLGTTLSRMETAWLEARRSPSLGPAPQPGNAAPGSQAWKDWQEAQQAYWTKYHEWWMELQRKQPWYFRYLEFIVAWSCVTSALWVLWALLRAVGVRRAAPPIARPPTCEACGYNLTAMSIEGRCPECGEPVALSLGPTARAGTPWHRRREIGRLTAWWLCTLKWLCRPKELGRQIRVVSPDIDHRGFLVMHLPVIFIFAWMGILSLYVVEAGRSPFFHDTDFLFFACPVLAVVVALAALGLSMLAAGMIGLGFLLDCKRNLLSGAMQVVSYLSGCLTLWIAFAFASGAGAFAFAEAGNFYTLERATGINEWDLALLAWLLPNIACLVGYFGLVVRGTAGTRFANR
jgi:hypothetical protein